MRIASSPRKTNGPGSEPAATAGDPHFKSSAGVQSALAQLLAAIDHGAPTSSKAYGGAMPVLDYPSPELADEIVRLRRWTFDDLECVAEASTDPRIPEGTTVPFPYSNDEGRSFVERQWARQSDGQGLSLAIATTVDDVAVGVVVLLHRPQPGNIGIGYWVVASARGHGYATSAVRLLTDWAIKEAGVERIEAWVEPDNTASRHVLEATGFELEGRLRNFLAFPTRRADALSYSRVAHG